MPWVFSSFYSEHFKLNHHPTLWKLWKFLHYCFLVVVLTLIVFFFFFCLDSWCLTLQICSWELSQSLKETHTDFLNSLSVTTYNLCDSMNSHCYTFLSSDICLLNPWACRALLRLPLTTPWSVDALNKKSRENILHFMFCLLSRITVLPVTSFIIIIQLFYIFCPFSSYLWQKAKCSIFNSITKKV